MINKPLMAKILATFIFFKISSANITFANDFYPSVILKSDSYYSHHILIAEKSTHLLHLFEHNDQKPKLIHSYPMATGKIAGDKKFEGDFKTPEGIFHFNRFMNHDELIKQSGEFARMYGAGAFVMNYPNPFDKYLNKTGSGIWLHSTNDETRIDKGLDSRGCVVTANKELIDVSRFIELNKTPMVVVQELKYLSKTTFSKQKEELENFLNSWLESWRNKDINKYAEHYLPTAFKDGKKNFGEFKAYKKLIFSNPGNPEINLENISILKTENYAVVTFTQKYKFTKIDDVGKKSLYLILDDKYQWKILSEQWTKAGTEELDNEIKFSPSLRFFNEEHKNINYTKAN